MLKEKLNQDIKTALLSGDKITAEVLKSLKSAILYEEVALKVRAEGLTDAQVQIVLAREAKKRADSAAVYAQADQRVRAEAELAEKAIIDTYLPAQITDDELKNAVAAAIAEAGPNPQMGPIIGAVKAKVGVGADGARVAAAVKTALIQS